MHVAVIGAGAAGLCTAKHLKDLNSKFTCVIYEQTDSIGGTWVYTEETVKDKYGLPICSAMYKNLKTNLGKENMEFPGFPFLNSKSFVTAAEVLKYLNDYADNYNLRENIRFLSHVKCVLPMGETWELTTVDLPSGTESVEYFDAVVVCNGHFSVPNTANLPGITDFRGEVKHSHTYRTPEQFINKTVLVCGGGPSGIDITYDLTHYASKVYFSHKSDLKPDDFPENVKQVPVVKVVEEDHVIFEDGSYSESIDIILLCTGYKYSFPFLAPECEITVAEGKFVKPLYKQIININHPTMGFIGLPFRSFLFPLFYYQVRFFLKTLTQEVKLPSKEAMFTEFETFIHQKQEQGVPLRKYHEIKNELKFYMEDLAASANLEYLPPVVYNIYDATFNLRRNHLPIYRNAVFHIINESKFKITGLEILEKEEEDFAHHLQTET